MLYLTTSLGRVVALDPVTGKKKGSYDSKVPKDMGYGDFANRGVSAWTGSKTGLKLFLATIDARLISIDAATGKTAQGFGAKGIVNLRAGLRIPVPENRFADYEETSPPAVAGNTVIVGSGIAMVHRPHPKPPLRRALYASAPEGLVSDSGQYRRHGVGWRGVRSREPYADHPGE